MSLLRRLQSVPTGLESLKRLMEYTSSQAIEATDQDWKADQEEAANCAPFDVDSLVDRVVRRWKSACIGYRAIADGPRQNRVANRSLAASLRAAEQAMVAVVSAALRVYTEGYTVRRMPELMKAIARCRWLAVLPVARRMAARDDLGRSASDIAALITLRAQFVDGRAVIDQSLASELPSPYATEVSGD
jgi:hypothetical protein